MKDFLKKLIDEHKQLVVRLEKLDKFIYHEDTSHVSKADFANLCMQLSAMRQYERCLLARLVNNGIAFEDNEYYLIIDRVGEPNKEDKSSDKGSDNDIDLGQEK